MENQIIKKQRIQWIDIAKGIIILTMIAGHTVEYGGTIRNFIFSFHMPLFFILSGYTYKIPKAPHDLAQQLKKDFRHLYLPCIIVAWLYEILVTISNHTPFNWLIVIQRLLWGNGNDNHVWNNHFFPGIGVVWFLIALLLAKLLYGFFQIITRNYNNIGSYIILAYIGIMIGRKLWLPQSLDVALIAILFLHVGHLWKNNEVLFQKHLTSICILSAIIWILPLEKGIYIEMATRQYPWGILCILEAIGATFLISQFARLLESLNIIRNIFLFIGQHTLEILCIHCLDSIFWNWNPKDSLIRILFNIIVLIGYLLIKKLLKNIFSKVKLFYSHSV